MFTLSDLRVPIVGAPMGGGPSTTELAAAVGEAGGLGFIAGGYLEPQALRERIAHLRAACAAPFGVNLFAPSTGTRADAEAIRAYVSELHGEAAAAGVALGEPVRDDDAWAAKLDVVCDERPAVVSLTFGCPERAVVERLHDAGCSVWVTVTSRAEASTATSAGADALVVQGTEAGGHRGGFLDEADGGMGLLALLRVVSAAVELPLVATGGIGDGAAVAAVLCAGASAAQIGSALMLAAEAGTAAAHREALRRPASTALTRAFTGRLARGVVNRFMREHDARAPAAYPEIHHVTRPLRAAARERGDAETLHLWAGQAHELAQERPAGEIVAAMAADARAALAAATAALTGAG